MRFSTGGPRTSNAALRRPRLEGSSRSSNPKMDDPTRLTRTDRIRLHLRCPWRSWREMRFHLAGILREFQDRWS